ncbi:LIM domain protein (macronuclear) [Tetrahymena thermophila SB210]|uniref:LIM domain protein n=1 Tax=Tetrahymena thermophila (strain SB210) TaxID=312017 RepID=I7M0R9_TETTS|nr:LIM domain protein [Tetrahymena thermophila SB210]EAR90820.1 LIM domain protein [Tetrahymena thermophila SB210]|eukprot:XP_001011065.1 LIM domain protein [Tetrahymena thermophila SB210]
MEQPSICAKCNEQINDAKCVIVGEKFYHENHFTCSSCQADLSTQQYHQENDDYYCIECYSQNIAPKCAACGLAIIENIVQLADGVELHKECFVCFRCKKQLTAEYVQDEDKHIVCNECLEQSVDKCDSCQQAILDCKISTGGKVYHQSCFKCNKCDLVIEQENHLEQDGQIFHARCLNLQCSYCNEIILSGYYKYKDMLYHIECYEKEKQELQREQEQINNNTEQLLADVREEVEKEEQKLKEEEEEQQRKKQHEEEEERKKELERNNQLELEKLKQMEKDTQKTQQLKTQQLAQKQKIQDQQNEDQGKQKLSDKIKQFETNNSQNKEIQVKQNDNNASLKVEEPKKETIPNTSSSNQSEPISYKVIPYSVLTSNPPSDVDFTKKEVYLSDQEFHKIFQMNKQEFAALKAWRQKELKQKHKLF